MIKEKNRLRIVFLGTPDFAVASLEALLNAGYSVPGVVTAPDKPAGRGKKLQAPAVKKYALSKGLKVLQPSRLKDPVFLNELRSLKADLQVVVAFRMLPEEVWKMPPLGTVNLHASLLPQYRGAAPIHRAIINGEKETGLTTFLLQHEIDTGKILLQKKLSIGPDETAGELHDRMMMLGAQLLVETIEGLRLHTLTPIDQKQLTKPGEMLKTAPKIRKEDCRIDWNNDPDTVHNFIRGLSPFPGAFSLLQPPKGEAFQVKIYRTLREPASEQLHPGTLVTDGKLFIRVAVADGFIRLLELQFPGKKRLQTAELLRGFSLDDRWFFR
jgi:methionyl-tRNA formyltransferase